MTTQKVQSPAVIRMPLALREWLKQCANDNHRSFSGEVIHRLQQSRQREEQEKTRQQGAAQ